MKTLFHVTAYKNLESIFEKGLISSKGKNSKKLSMTEEAYFSAHSKIFCIGASFWGIHPTALQ